MADQQQDYQPAVAINCHTEHSSEAPTSAVSQRLDVVPDSLVAMAKDARYVKEIQGLFLQVLSSFLPRRRHQLLEQESWTLASLLCLALGLRNSRDGATLGMEAVGLKFPRGAARWKFVVSVLFTLGWAYGFSSNRRSDATTTTSNNDNGLPCSPDNNDEELRGSRRREFHEQQRQAMLRRAEHAARAGDSTSNSNNTTSGVSGRTAVQLARGFSANALRRKIKSILIQLAKILASATLSPFEGPHTLPSETHQQQQQSESPGTASFQQAGRWLAKLILAHFCLTGMHPTWVHRLSGHGLEPSTDFARLNHRPTTARVVGLLLGAQVAATFVQSSSSAVSKWLVHTQHRRQSRSAQPQQQSTPAVVFESESQSTLNVNSEGAGNTSSICSICKMERKHPSAPESCGHVFCWKCLVQWVSGIRPECPLCRASCRPQDIVALYNYEPNSA